MLQCPSRQEENVQCLLGSGAQALRVAPCLETARGLSPVHGATSGSRLLFTQTAGISCGATPACSSHHALKRVCQAVNECARAYGGSALFLQ